MTKALCLRYLLPIRLEHIFIVVQLVSPLVKFERTFPEVVVNDQHRNHATLQSLLVAIYVSEFNREVNTASDSA